jgi:hypothetical protein
MPGESAEMAAAREFAEESLCVIRMGDEVVDSECFAEDAQRRLENKEFLYKLEILHNKPEGQSYVRVLFVVQVPWQPDVCAQFASQREALLGYGARDCHPAVRDGVVDAHYLEKDVIEFWSPDRLGEVARNDARYRDARFRRGFVRFLMLVLKWLLP